MESGARDGAAVRVPPPLVFLAAVVIGALLHAYVLPLAIALPPAVRIGGAGLLGVPGLALVAAAWSHFKRTGQDPKPWLATPEIISGGVYRFTRNPMYVGMGLLQLAIGVGSANGWIAALAPVALAVVYATAVRHEEAYLEAKFGEGYRAYKQSVRRWL